MKLYEAFATLFAVAACALPASAQAPATSQPAPPTRTAVPAPAAAATPAVAHRTSPSQMTAAAGGGPGQVWVNTASKVYHCPGSTYYGKTKAGKYMTEDAAKAEGDRANAGKPCGK